MSQEDIELVIGVFTLAGSPEVDMGALMADDEHWQRNKEKLGEDLKITFFNPSDAHLNIMEQEFRGLDGLREGWDVWMLPWDKFRVTVDDMIDTSAGSVLMLGSAIVRIKGTGADFPQEVASLFRIEAGKIVEIGYYLDQDQARRDAGLA